MRINNIIKVCVMVMLFIVIIGFVYGGVITKKDSELTAEFLKNELGVEIISEGGCKGCSYIRNDDTYEEILTIPQGVKIKKCIEFCWLGDLKLNGGTIVYDDGSELTGKAACVGVCFIEKGDFRLKSGELLHIENADKVYLNKGVINGECGKKNCVFAGSSIKAPASFSYKDGVLEVDGDVYASSSLQFKGLKLKGDARFILPDKTKIKVKGGEVVKINKDGSYLIPKEGILTTSDNIITTVDAEARIIPIGNDVRCKKDSNCVKFDDKSIDIYGEGISTRLPKNFNKEIKTFPKLKGKEITTIYPDGVKVIAKGEKGYPKIEPPGKSVNGYSMNGEKLSYMINGDDVQVCSIEFNDITGSVVGVEAAGVKCKDGKVIEAGTIGIGDDINVGMPINEDINCKVNYIEMPDKTKPVDVNKDGKVDYVLDVGIGSCYKLDDYIKIKRKCKTDNRIEFKIRTCIEDNLPEGLLRGKGYKITEEISLPKDSIPKAGVPPKVDSYYDKLLDTIKDIYDISDNENSINRIVCVIGLRTKEEIAKGSKAIVYGDSLSLGRYCKIMKEKKFMVDSCYKRMVKVCSSYQSANP